MKRTLTFGFMVHEIENEYSSELLKGLIPAAEELSINLIILPGQALNGQYHDTDYTAYEYQHNVLYEYCSSDTLDGLIISAGTIGSFVSDEEFTRFVNRYKYIPLITLEKKVGNYPCIQFDGGGIYDAVCHLISQHGIKRIGFVSGPDSNPDAILRLQAYKQALLDNQLPVLDELIVYGDFSEYSTEQVRALLQAPGGRPEGICFANDSMCIGAYKVFEEEGLIPGQDILVTGYDDSITASVLSPHLTTVRSSASKLGYEAVNRLYRMINMGEYPPDIRPSATLVVRASCGCNKYADLQNTIPTGSLSTDDTTKQKLQQQVRDIVLNTANEPCCKKEEALLAGICDFIWQFTMLCIEPEEKDMASLIVELDALLNQGALQYLRYLNLTNIIDRVYETASIYCHPKHHADALALLRKIERHIFDFEYRQHTASDSDFDNTIFEINNITKDMTLYADDESDCFYSMLHKIKLMHFTSCMIYFYEKPIRHRKKNKWKMPETLSLMGTLEYDRIEIPKRSRRAVSWNKVFRSSINPNRPRIMVCMDIASNDKQYGLFIIEAPMNRYRFLQSIVSQICTAIRMNLLVRSLESSLSEEKQNNDALNVMSMTDELTQINNRRGFYVHSNELLASAKSLDKNAYVIFADLNNLKIVNDTFGHEEGDYAICEIANILREALGPDAIVSRIGGDEYAALSITDEPDYADKIFRTIKEMAAERNLASPKPYNVTVSLGIHTFVCSANDTVQKYMEFADSALYEDKLTKDTNIMK